MYNEYYINGENIIEYKNTDLLSIINIYNSKLPKEKYDKISIKVKDSIDKLFGAEYKYEQTIKSFIDNAEAVNNFKHKLDKEIGDINVVKNNAINNNTLWFRNIVKTLSRNIYLLTGFNGIVGNSDSLASTTLYDLSINYYKYKLDFMQICKDNKQMVDRFHMYKKVINNDFRGAKYYKLVVASILKDVDALNDIISKDVVYVNKELLENLLCPLNEVEELLNSDYIVKKNIFLDTLYYITQFVHLYDNHPPCCIMKKFITLPDAKGSDYINLETIQTNELIYNSFADAFIKNCSQVTVNILLSNNVIRQINDQSKIKKPKGWQLLE